jgi:hypothetical protein
MIRNPCLWSPTAPQTFTSNSIIPWSLPPWILLSLNPAPQTTLSLKPTPCHVLPHEYILSKYSSPIQTVSPLVTVWITHFLPISIVFFTSQLSPTVPSILIHSLHQPLILSRFTHSFAYTVSSSLTQSLIYTSPPPSLSILSIVQLFPPSLFRPRFWSPLLNVSLNPRLAC